MAEMVAVCPYHMRWWVEELLAHGLEAGGQEVADLIGGAETSDSTGAQETGEDAGHSSGSG